MSTTIEDLEATIAADPEQVEAYLVLADALTGRGDPRGELIVVQHQRISRPKDRRLEKRERRLLERIEKQLVLNFDEFRWRLGFVERVRIDFSKREWFGHRFLGILLADSNLKFLTDLRVTSARGHAHLPIASLGAKPRPTLRRLSLVELVGASEPACEHEPNPLWPLVPNLERLHLRSERPLFHSIEHHRLERLDLEMVPLCDRGRWELPGLRVLDWDPHIESECDVSVFDNLWQQRLPMLRDLRIRGHLVTSRPTLARPEVVRVIQKLRRLVIAADAIAPYRSTVSLADHLIANAMTLSHLEKLIVHGVDRDEAGDLTAVHQRLPQLEIQETIL